MTNNRDILYLTGSNRGDRKFIRETINMELNKARAISGRRRLPRDIKLYITNQIRMSYQNMVTKRMLGIQ